MFVDDQLNLLSVETLARGDLASCRVSFSRIVSRGLALRAAGFLLIHNHPSGDPRPSQEDIRFTVRLAGLTKELDMPLLDHLIIGRENMMSVGGF